MPDYSPEIFRTPSGGYPSTNAISFTGENINATGNKFAYCGPVWFAGRTGTKAIRRVAFRFNAVTKAGGSALTVSLQNVSVASSPLQPDETQDQTVAIANGDGTFLSNSWHRTGTFSADRTVAFGEMLAIVFEYDGSGRLGADNFQISRLNNAIAVHGSSAVTKISGTWAAVNGAPNIVLEFSDGTFGTLAGGFPASAVGTLSFNVGTGGADEYGVEVQFPRDVLVDLANWFMTLASASADAEFLVYSGTTVLATVTLDAAMRATSVGAMASAVTGNPVAFSANTTYRIAIRPTTANPVVLTYFDVADAGHMACHIGGTAWGGLASRLDQGSWAAATATRRPFLDPFALFELAEDVEEEPTFENGRLTTGLTWIIITTRSGAQYVFSDRPLPDRSTYYLGWKAPLVTRWGKIRRALSRFDGEHENSDFVVEFDDSSRFFRQLDADKELVNGTAAVYMIEDEGRRAEETAKTVYRGVLRDATPLGTLSYRITIKDVFEDAFSVNSNPQQVPERTFPLDDFENCDQTLVSSSAESYVVNGGTSGGATTVPVRDGWGVFAPGDKVKFGAGTEVYAVTIASSLAVADGLDVETSIEITPALAGALSDGDAVTQIPSHAVDAAFGQGVTFAYGFITDYKIDGGEDVGDGQGPWKYVGDKVLSDDRTYGEFVWQGHACYSPGGKPIKMLYFWNESVDNLGGSFAFPDIDDLSVEAGSGGRIAIPGYDLWDDLGFAHSYVDYNSRRYTLGYLRGVFRDWALGIRPAPANLGGVPCAVAGYGAETIGDASGILIKRGIQQAKHIVKNWIPPRGESYQGGLWMDAPTFPDDPTLPMIDEDSFDRADAQSEIYVGDAEGFQGDFIVGANNERITRRALLARLHRSFALDGGFNRKTQYFVDLINTDLDTMELQAALTYVRDIFSGTWSIEPITRELYTTLPFRHTQDYFNRATGGWRSITSGVLETENEDATDDYGSKTWSPQYNLYMVRGKNRSSDPDDYLLGTATAAAVLRLKLARVSTVQHVPKWQTGPAGFNYELGHIIPVTHYEGLSNVGWTDRPLRAERTETDPTSYTEAVESFDIDPMIGIGS